MQRPPAAMPIWLAALNLKFRPLKLSARGKNWLMASKEAPKLLGTLANAVAIATSGLSDYLLKML